MWERAEATEKTTTNADCEIKARSTVTASKDQQMEQMKREYSTQVAKKDVKISELEGLVRTTVDGHVYHATVSPSGTKFSIPSGRRSRTLNVEYFRFSFRYCHSNHNCIRPESDSTSKPRHFRYYNTSRQLPLVGQVEMVQVVPLKIMMVMAGMIEDLLGHLVVEVGVLLVELVMGKRSRR